MSDFYRTVMGHRFYEGTMPELVAQLRRLNDNFERLLAHMDKAYAQGYRDAQREEKDR
jgi:hypothetical protein